jgi:aryl-phospho-beta-D-glucosidase BglC (GH1 family)
MDHVRLPIDYMVLEEDSNPFLYKEEGFAYIDNCIRWCINNNLNIILDLHKTAGYAFDSLGDNSLFENEQLKERFVSLWRAFALRYQGYGENMVFEL